MQSFNLSISCIWFHINGVFFSAQADQSVDSLIVAIEVYNDIVNNLKDGLKGFYIGEDVSTIAQELQKQDLNMGQTQRDAITVLITINQDCHSAINAARNIVSSMRSTCESIQKELTQKNRDSVNNAISKFVSTAESLETKVREAIALSIEVKSDSVLGNISSLFFLFHKDGFWFAKITYVKV